MLTAVTNWLGHAQNMMSGRYVRSLEDEVTRQRGEVARERAENERQREVNDRLRAENRALLNSLLGTAGIAPIEMHNTQPQSVPPVRRRSWPQIATAREIESARQSRHHDLKVRES